MAFWGLANYYNIVLGIFSFADFSFRIFAFCWNSKQCTAIFTRFKAKIRISKIQIAYYNSIL